MRRRGLATSSISRRAARRTRHDVGQFRLDAELDVEALGDGDGGLHLRQESRHASASALSGCHRHWSSGSRVPVQSVTSRVSIARAGASRGPQAWRRPVLRTAGSGWIML